MIPISAPQIGLEEEEAVLRVLRSGRLAQGSEVEAFEEEFASMCGAHAAVACANGTAALHLALLANGIGPQDEVLVPAFTFAATANAVLATGSQPVFCDVREDDFCIDTDDAARRVTSRTKAIIAVHLYGQVADMDGVLALASEKALVVVEDACQAPGAAFAGRIAGSFGSGGFSFYATKNMTSGEGGMVTAPDEEIASRVRLLRNHGMVRRYVHETFGLNLRMTELAAALGRVQLAKLPAATSRRRENAAFYLSELAATDGLVLPSEMPGRRHAWHQFTVRLPAGRDTVLASLRAAGVGAEVYYPTPVHRQRAFQPAGGSLPVAERLAGEVLSIPVHPRLSDGDRATVAKAMADAVTKGR